MNPIEISFVSKKPTMTVEASADGKKKVIIMGSLMNSKFNANHWRIAEEEAEKLASQFAGMPLKIKHGDKYTNCGNGIEAHYDASNDDINYKTEVVGDEEVKKFESGAWNANNMGVSPKIRYERAECSVCGQDVRSCKHILGKNYEGKLCEATCYGSTLVEHSLTDEPAYGTVDSGNISSVFMAMIEGEKMQQNEFEAKMKENEDLIAEKVKVIAEKDTVIAEKDGVIETLNDKYAKASKEIEDSKKIMEATKTKLDSYVRAERMNKLEEVFDKEKHKDLIASILGQNLSEEDFNRKIMELKAVKTMSASNVGAGSAPVDKTNDLTFEECWGSPKDSLMAEIIAKKGVAQ